LNIDFSTQNLDQFCAVLSEFALPRALFQFDTQMFVAWTPSFLARAACSEDEIKSIKVEELLVFGDSWLPLSDDEREHRVEFISCAARRPFGGHPAPGYIVRSRGKIGYVMLDVFDQPSVQFDQGRTVGHEEERDRIIKAYHNEVSSSMIEALFLLETVKSELQEAGAPQAEIISKASDKLVEATEKMAVVLGSTEEK
jgi:hypothetical protein